MTLEEILKLLLLGKKFACLIYCCHLVCTKGNKNSDGELTSA